jgi:uncharacterized protein (DUF1684 family)
VTLEKSKTDEFIVDFNLAYNPSYEYSAKYKRVLVPFENRLSIPIQAGIENVISF